MTTAFHPQSGVYRSSAVWPRVGTHRERASMSSFLQPVSIQTYALLGIVTGILFLWRSSLRLFSVPLSTSAQFPDLLIVIARPIGFIGGAVSSWTRWPFSTMRLWRLPI